MIGRIARRLRPNSLPLALAVLAAAFLAWRMWRGFYFAKFGDEIEHILGAQILGAGGRLYRDFIDEHGPLPYAVAQAYGAIAGWAHPSRVRLIPALLAALATAAIVASPALRGAWERLLAAAVFMGLLATFWVVQGLGFLTYQPMAGVLLVWATALDAAPAWTGTCAPPAARVIAGASTVLACFAAYSYGPAAVLLLASRVAARWGAWGELRAIAAGGIAALLAAMAYFAAFVNPVGYLTYHFVLNQVFFAPFMTFRVWDVFPVLLPDFRPDRIVQTASSIAGVLGWALLFAPLLRWRVRPLLAPLLLAFAALAWSNPRGSPIMQDDAFVILAFAYFALALSRLPRAAGLGAPRWRMAALAVGGLGIVACELAGRQALSSPHSFTRAQLAHFVPEAMGRSDEPWAVALRRAVRPDERVLALPFYPDFYLLAGRLPMRGYYDYLPWEAAYAKHPWFGRDRDLCVDIRRDPPPVVYYNGWVVWGRYDPRNYMPCVLGVLGTDYVKAPGAADIFVRRDRLADWIGKSASAPAQSSLAARRLPAH